MSCGISTLNSIFPICTGAVNQPHHLKGENNMTRKRYQKLYLSEMTKLMAHKDGAAKCIKAAATNKASNWMNG